MNCAPILSVRNLSVEYPTTQATLRNISFDIHQGEVLGLVGESGSGKSTVCKVLLGLLGESAQVCGSIALCGREILPLCEEKRRKINGKDIGFVMQNPMTAFNPCMKIKDHFFETLRAHIPCSKKDAYLYGLDSLRRAGLPNQQKIMESFPFRLSGGMLQRVMIAIAISLNPVLIIADEPTTALDRASASIVLDLFTRVSKMFQPAILFVSHDMTVIGSVADRIAVMKSGCMIEEGPAAEVLNHPRHPYTKELIEATDYKGGD